MKLNKLNQLLEEELYEEETFQDLNNLVKEEAEEVKGALDKIVSRFEYRTLQNMSYSMKEASDLEMKLCIKFRALAKEVMSLHTLIG